MKKPSLGVLAGTFLSFFLFAAIANAATVHVAVDTTAPSVGQVVRVDVTLDTGGANANAVQAEVTFPSSLFQLEQIEDGGSAVSLWLNPPAQSAPGTIDLAGIMPGGFNGTDGDIFSFVLKPLVTGAGTIQIATATVLANDGLGSALPVNLDSVAITVGAALPSTPSAPVPPLIDYSAPNPFTPQIASDPNIFNGEYFLVFSTTDSGSGIDHYEVLEVPSGDSVQPHSSWHVASSPYLLTDQNLSSDIYARAVDHDGNFIVVKVLARYPYARWNYWEPFVTAIFAIMVVVLLLIWMRRRRRHI